MPGGGGDFVPARASGGASLHLQEMWGPSSYRATMTVSRVAERTIGTVSSTGYL